MALGQGLGQPKVIKSPADASGGGIGIGSVGPPPELKAPADDYAILLGIVSTGASKPLCGKKKCRMTL